MKLVEKVIEQIPQQNLQTLSDNYNIGSDQITNALNALVPGILSAFKAKIVTGLNDGNSADFLNLVSNFNSDTSDNRALLTSLFGKNQDVIDTLIQRVSAFSGINEDVVKSFIPAAMPAVMTGVTEMIQNVTVDSAIATGSEALSNFFSGNSTHSPYESAIKAANDFLGNVFGGQTAEKLAAESNQLSPQNDFAQTILDLLDQDNDGSVMDDIYHMLVR